MVRPSPSFSPSPMDYYHSMHPIELGRQLLTDLMRLPMTFKLFLLFAAGAALWDWLKNRLKADVISKSESWPSYRARVVWAQVTDRQYHGEDDSSYVEGVLTYSYTVPGHELEIGEYRKRFEYENEAAAWARSLRDSFIEVRVDPADVKRSVYHEDPIVAAAFSREHVIDSSGLEESEEAGTRPALATAVLFIAALGAFFAAWIQLSYLMGRPVISAGKNSAAFFGMHLGAMACAIGVGFIARRGRWSASSLKKTIDAAMKSPAIKILGLYTTVVFLYGWIRMAANDGDSQYFTVLMFSAVWLVLYVGAATSALAAIQHRSSDLRGEP